MAPANSLPLAAAHRDAGGGLVLHLDDGDVIALALTKRFHSNLEDCILGQLRDVNVRLTAAEIACKLFPEATLQEVNEDICGALVLVPPTGVGVNSELLARSQVAAVIRLHEAHVVDHQGRFRVRSSSKKISHGLTPCLFGSTGALRPSGLLQHDSVVRNSNKLPLQATTLLRH